MKNLGQMMKQAQQMQQKVVELQQELEAIEVTGASGGGMVEVTLNGKSEARRVRIDPALFASSDAEMLEDLVLAAINNAKAKVQQMTMDKMSEITGGLPLPPGMQLPF